MKQILHTLLLIITLGVHPQLSAQQITRVEQVGNNIVVDFTFDSTIVPKELLVSIDGGNTYSQPLKHVVISTDGHTGAAVWNPIKEMNKLMGENIRFKINFISYSSHTKELKAEKKRQEQIAQHEKKRQEQIAQQKKRTEYWNRNSWNQGGEQTFIPFFNIYESGIGGGGFSYGVISSGIYGGFELCMGKESIGEIMNLEQNTDYSQVYSGNNYFNCDINFALGAPILPWFIAFGGVGVGFKNDIANDAFKASLPLQAGCILRIGSRRSNAAIIKGSINSSDFFVRSHYYTIGIGWTIKGEGLYD